MTKQEKELIQRFKELGEAFLEAKESNARIQGREVSTIRLDEVNTLFKTLPKEVRTEPVFLAAIEHFPLLYNFMDYDEKTEATSMLAAKLDGATITDIPRHLQDDEIILECAKHSGHYTLSNIKRRLDNAKGWPLIEEACLIAVKQDSEALYLVPKNIRNYYECCLVAMEHTGQCLENVKLTTSRILDFPVRLERWNTLISKIHQDDLDWNGELACEVERKIIGPVEKALRQYLVDNKLLKPKTIDHINALIEITDDLDGVDCDQLKELFIKACPQPKPDLDVTRSRTEDLGCL